MSRWALFIDAGWLFAAGSTSAFGERKLRRDIGWDPLRLPDTVAQRAAQLVPSAAELLRIYWYDGSPNRLPIGDQHTVAQLPDVKLRLGRTARDGQKGVDGLIIHDLITHAYRRTIDDAVVLSGDEDLLDAIESAQANGTRVHLLEIPIGGIADPLLRAVDRRGQLDEQFWKEQFQLIQPQAPTEQKFGERATTRQPTQANSTTEEGAPLPRPEASPESQEESSQAASGSTASEQAASGSTTSEQAASGSTASDLTTGDLTTGEQAAAEQAASEQSASEQAASDSTAPQRSSRESTRGTGRQIGIPTPPSRPAWLDEPLPVNGLHRSVEPSHRADEIGDLVECGSAFAERWAASADPDEFAELLAARPYLPREIDAQLLREACPDGGWLDQVERRILRDAFWTSLTDTSPNSRRS